MIKIERTIEVSYRHQILFTKDVFQRNNPILHDVLAGFTAPGGITVEQDREAAVTLAILSAQDSDTVLLAGKGHEDYQILGTEKVHMDDRELAQKALLNWSNDGMCE